MICLTRFENGLTVRELKEIIKDWPEENEYGEPCEVWLGDGGGFSNQAREVSALNLRSNGNREWADLLLTHDA